jgi:hypothetical protein
MSKEAREAHEAAVEALLRSNGLWEPFNGFLGSTWYDSTGTPIVYTQTGSWAVDVETLNYDLRDWWPGQGPSPKSANAFLKQIPESNILKDYYRHGLTQVQLAEKYHRTQGAICVRIQKLLLACKYLELSQTVSDLEIAESVERVWQGPAFRTMRSGCIIRDLIRTTSQTEAARLNNSTQSGVCYKSQQTLKRLGMRSQVRVVLKAVNTWGKGCLIPPNHYSSSAHYQKRKSTIYTNLVNNDESVHI